MMRLAKIKVKSQEIISNKNIEVLVMIYFIILIIKIGMILHMSAKELMSQPFQMLYHMQLCMSYQSAAYQTHRHTSADPFHYRLQEMAALLSNCEKKLME